MKLGSVNIAHPFTLAPMEEHTSYPLRRLMKQHGASLVCSERVDAVDVAQKDRRALRLLYTATDEKPRVGQISGGDPAVMAAAARVVEEQGFDIVDLNFECPIKRLTNRGEGGALMADPGAIESIASACVKAVSIPVTLKLRTGPNAEQETAVEITQRAESVGVAGVEIHARSVAQAYVGGPDWSVVARVKQATSIPVFGSGGVREPIDAIRYLEESGADGVAIGRGCLGNPWIFRQIVALYQGGAQLPPPSSTERSRVLLRLVEDEFHFYGPTVALRRLPRVSCYFAKHLPDFAEFRTAVNKVRSLGEFRQLARSTFGS
jgi:tRNA-dihydrouridine synthase B